MCMYIELYSTSLMSDKKGQQLSSERLVWKAYYSLKREFLNFCFQGCVDSMVRGSILNNVRQGFA